MDTPLAERRPTRAPTPARIAAQLPPALFADTRQGEAMTQAFTQPSEVLAELLRRTA